MSHDHILRQVEERVRRVNAFIGNRMRMRRLERGLTRAAVAREVGLRPKMIDEVEEGRREVALDQLLAISKLLGVPPTYFYEGLRELLDAQGADDREPAHVIVPLVAHARSPVSASPHTSPTSTQDGVMRRKAPSPDNVARLADGRPGRALRRRK